MNADPVHPGADCPTCRTPLDLNQPDQDAPDLLVGYCARCKCLLFVRRLPDASLDVKPAGRWPAIDLAESA